MNYKKFIVLNNIQKDLIDFKVIYINSNLEKKVYLEKSISKNMITLNEIFKFLESEQK